MTPLHTFKQKSSPFNISQFVFLKSIPGASKSGNYPGFLTPNLPSMFPGKANGISK